jgi:hypothetical protein
MTDPSFKDALLSRHDEHDWICVSAYKLVNGKFVVSERFCNGVDEAANLIARSYKREDIGAIWTNLQRLKPGSSRRKKGETIDAYTNVVVDIDRRIKKDADGNKVNATDEERAVLYTAAEKVMALLAPHFGPAVLADSGNGFHVSWRCEPLTPAEGREIYRDLLATLSAKFESPGVNMEIDRSLADDTQVVTVWGTFNRKYPEILDRPQRQSKVLLLPTQHPITRGDIMLAIAENEVRSEKCKHCNRTKDEGCLCGAWTTKKAKSNTDKLKANPEWLEDFGVPDLIEHWEGHIAYESDAYDKGGDTYHPITPCPCHENEDLHVHSHSGDCCIIEYIDGGIGIGCFSRDFGLKTVISKMNKIVGEKYPYMVYAEESTEELIEAFGAVKEAITPVGELCYRENCACGNVHLQRSKPQELFEDEKNDKSFDLVRTQTKDGHSGLRVLRVSDSPDRPVDWLWTGRLPAGGAFTVSGPIGCNKSMALIDMAARISNGADWPDGAHNEFGAREVLICATEDELQTVIRPRLRAAGANLEKCLYLENAFEEKDGVRNSRAMNLEEDTQRLYEALKARPEILLVILDPVTGFYGNADPNDNRKIRQMITKIAKMCMKTRTSVACIVHENKKSDVNVVDKMMGASSLSQIVRAGMRFSFDTERKPNGRIMASLKNSYGGRGGGMKFDVEQTDMLSTGGKELKNIGYVRWTETHTETADEVRERQQAEREAGPEDSKLGIAMKIFETELANGKRLHKEVHPILEAAGISDATKRRARQKLGVASSPAFPWYWWLPGKEHAPDSPERKILDPEVL